MMPPVVAAALHVTGSHMLRAAREKAAMLCSCAFHACLLLMAKYTVLLQSSLQQQAFFVLTSFHYKPGLSMAYYTEKT